jgi:hypothetical protein
LKTPAGSKDDQAKLKQARRLAAIIVGADKSNVPLVHPIRWPGSLHRKNDPKLCCIVSLNDDAEIDLDTALKILQEATGDIELPPIKVKQQECELSPEERKHIYKLFGHLPVESLAAGLEANLDELRSAVAAIPPEAITHEYDWMRFARALAWEARLYPERKEILWEMLDGASRRAPKYDERNNRIRFERHIAEAFDHETPNTPITIFYIAKEHGWRWPDPKDFPAPPIPPKLFQSSAEFVAGFVPPDYLIDGWLQRRYVYSLTAKTGDGKTTIALLVAAYVAKGRTLAGCEVEKGRVLIFAGENPDDVRTRWILLCEVLGEDPDQMDVVFMPFTANLSAEAVRAQIDAEATKAGPFALLIVDTSASYYSGNDENDNVQLGHHARMLRSFVELPGGPTILVTCHPAKNPDMTNLLPRGGGAFLAEVDGNLVAIKDASTLLVEITTHGKFRGPDFAPFTFKLVPAQSPKIIDSKGRKVWSIYAEAVSDAEQERLEGIGHSEQRYVLEDMLEHPGSSLTEIAKRLHWSTGKGKPNKQRVHRLMTKLQGAGLVKRGYDDRYTLTASGQKEAKEKAKSR